MPPRWVWAYNLGPGEMGKPTWTWSFPISYNALPEEEVVGWETVAPLPP